MKLAALPPMIYGTAWKEESTAELVKKAVNAGFRAIDTANQKKHYREDYTGSALLELKKSGISREDLFLQSKFTYRGGQDHRLPYDPDSDLTTQVASSFLSTLKNLHAEYLDSYLLHGPASGRGMTDNDWEVWAAMEKLQEADFVRMIGISNAGLSHVKALCEKARVKPKFVQNRCYAAHGWDREVREYCLANKIIYQGFSLLTANQQVLFHPKTAVIAKRLQATPMQVIFKFCVQIGILPLTGTTSSQHMKQDLEIKRLELSKEEIETIFSISG